MALFPRELKHEYLQARYAQYRTFALRLGIATVFVPMGLWLRDDLSYAAGAWDTLGFRLLMSAGVLAYVAALALRAPRRVVLLAAYLAVLAIDVAASMVWGAVPIHASVGFADYVYLFLLAPLLLLPLSLFEVVAVLVTACLVPNLQAAFGMAPHYSLPLFNLVMWPACAARRVLALRVRPRVPSAVSYPAPGARAGAHGSADGTRQPALFRRARRRPCWRSRAAAGARSRS